MYVLLVLVMAVSLVKDTRDMPKTVLARDEQHKQSAACIQNVSNISVITLW